MKREFRKKDLQAKLVTPHVPLV